jgi:gluconate:H+ symporter, GntP family
VHDFYLAAVSCAGIALSVWMIAKKGFHPFYGLICAALLIGVLGGTAPLKVMKEIEKGFGDILSGTGLVVTLGFALGAILQLSGGAVSLANAIFGRLSGKAAPYGAMITALIVGLPLFFETGVVLLMPIIAAGLAAKMTDERQKLVVMLSTLATLSVLHALLPPHPGPLIAARELGASVGLTLILGLIIAVPVALISGPILAKYTTRFVKTATPPLLPPMDSSPIAAWRPLIVLLIPIVLIASGSVLRAMFQGIAEQETSVGISVLLALSTPPIALILAIVVSLVLLFPKALREKETQEAVWRDAVGASAGIVLAIGAGGSLKQVLIGIGLPDMFGRLAALDFMSPLFVAWLVAAAIRVATGSATVATITAAGVMGTVVQQSGIDPAWFVLAIGSGSVFLSHVNDPGFWLVKGYLGTSTVDTFKLWSTLETVLSIVGLVLILALYTLTRLFI